MTAKLVFGMNVSLDGYVDHMKFAPDATLFRRFVEEAEGQAGSLYGRTLYELMRYWDDDDPDWDFGQEGLRSGVAAAAEMGRLAHA